MNYYERHIGDYLKNTAHLSLLEHGIYTRLMDVYYTREGGIPVDQVERLIGVRSKDERAALANVLDEFFAVEDGALRQARCDREIERFKDKQRKAKASADARWAQTERNANARRTHSEGNAHQSPVTSNQINTLAPTGACPVQPDPKPESVDREPPKPGLPDCPYDALRGLWRTHLPHLTQPRVWDGQRRVSMRNRWRQAARPSEFSPNGYATEPEGVAWWDSFFRYIANDTTLSAGFEGNGRTWQPDLAWVCKEANFQKIIDGNYAK